jgi:bifunctional non-homologous end joining protein LigD
MPGFKPQLATLKSKAPKGEQWLHEIKVEGYRIQVHLNEGKKKVCTRNGLDWTKRFSGIAGALDMPGQAIIDGEVVVTQEGQISSLSSKRRQDRLGLLRLQPLWRGSRGSQIERQRALLDLLGENDIELKRGDAPYRSERNESWPKIKEGKPEGRELVYMGKVGTGWSPRSQAKLESSSIRSSARSRS